MNEELIRKDAALRLLASAKKTAERAYKGDRLKGVLSGLNIAEGLIRDMTPVNEEAKENG
ncbi:MAG: hypothetical protein IJV41_10840 [Oscillospiraceae bacterium]|nr:hypothetical protein [Oscillospiraceae bacterium]